MKKFRRTALPMLIICYLLSYACVTAQEADNKKSETKDASKSYWLFTMNFGQVFDSNIDQDQKGLKSFGFVSSLGISYRDNPKRPSFKFDYEVGWHQYSQTDRWDRRSHLFVASYERRLVKHLSLETEGVVSLKGSSEDRELADQYVVQEQIKYRLNRWNRVKVYGAYRIKRYDDDSLRNTINPYVGAKYQLLSGSRSWTAGFRYDKSRPINPRGRYIRWTYSGEFSTPLSREGLLTAGVKYQPKLYARLIKSGERRVPRRDEKWTLSVVWEREVRKNLFFGLFGAFEAQDSNLIDKQFKANQVGTRIRYQWGT
jgi:hypothetical protein